MTWLQRASLCWFPHIAVAVMWNDVRGCWCYCHSAAQSSLLLDVSRLSHPDRILGLCPVNYFSVSCSCQHVPPAYLSGNGTVSFFINLCLYLHDKQRLWSVTDSQFSFHGEHPFVSAWHGLIRHTNEWTHYIHGLQVKTPTSYVCVFLKRKIQAKIYES